MKSRTPPCDIDAERAILGAILTQDDDGKKALQQVVDSFLSTDHFYSTANSIIYSAILTMHEAGKPVDLVTVIRELRDSNHEEELTKYVSDPMHYLDECIDACPTPKNVIFYVDIVKDKARRRLMLRQGLKLGKLMESVDDESVNVDDVYAEVQELVEDMGEEAEEIIPFLPRKEVFKVYSDTELQALEIERRTYIVDDWLPQGTVNLIAGKGKTGKSWLMLALAIAVASGGKWLDMNVSQGEVLYLSLEDDPARMKDRRSKLCPGEIYKDLYNAFNIPLSGAGGLKYLSQWVKDHKRAKLIIIDTFQRFRDRINIRASIYQEDYNAITPLQGLAQAFNVCILLVHHLKKATYQGEDPLDLISGSTGLSGSIDNLFVLSRERIQADATLFKVGRDITEGSVAMKFDQTFGLWSILGDAEEYRMSKERRDILDLLEDSKDGMTPTEIATLLQKRVDSIKFLLAKLEQDDFVLRVRYGKYIKK